MEIATQTTIWDDIEEQGQDDQRARWSKSMMIKDQDGGRQENTKVRASPLLTFQSRRKTYFVFLFFFLLTHDHVRAVFLDVDHNKQLDLTDKRL